MTFAALLGLLDRRWRELTLGLLLLVTGLSLIPKAQMPAAAQAYDKPEHLIAYAVLVLPLSFARPRGWLWMLAGVAAWSGAIELVQPIVNRATHLADFGSNLAGIALGAGIAAWLRRLRSDPRLDP